MKRLLLIVCALMGMASVLCGAEGGAMGTTVAPPKERILFQPSFYWANGKVTHPGTGFFISAPNGKVVGVTSAHFINFQESCLLKVKGGDLTNSEEIATFTRGWGLPTKGDFDRGDLRKDYFIMLAEKDVPSEAVLTLDERGYAEFGERVWFPRKCHCAPQGCHLIEGTIVKVSEKYSVVDLDKTIDLGSCSGTPIISQSTGKVVGLLTGGHRTHIGQTRLYLAPVSAISDTLAETGRYPLLRAVVGRE